MPLFTPTIETGSSQPIQAEGAKPASTALSTAPAVSQAAAGLIKFFGDADIADKKASAETAKNKQLANYTKELVNLGNIARTSKNVNTAALRVKADKLTMQFLDANPSMYAEAIKIRKEITSTTGLGKMLGEGTEEEKREARVTNAAADAGFVLPDYDDEQTKQGVSDYLRIQRSTKELEELAKRTDLNEKQKVIKAKSTLVEFFRSTTADFSRKIDVITDKYERGLIDDKQAKAELDNLYEVRQATASQIGANAGGDFISSQMNSTKTMYENSLSYLKGDFSKDVLANKKAILIGRQESEILADEKTAKIVALSSLFNHQNSALMARQNSVMITKHLGDISLPDGELPNPVIINPEDAADKRVAYDVVLENIRDFNSGNREFTDKEVETLDTSLNRLMTGLEENQLKIKSPKDIKDLITFFADPKLGKYVEKSGGMLPENLAIAKDVIQRQYVDKVIPKIREKIEQRRIAVLSDTGKGIAEGGAVAQYININPNNGTVNFTANEEVIGRLDKLGQNSIRTEVKELNRTLAPMINEMVRAGTHLEGNTNYTKFLNDNLESIFGMSKQEDKPQTQTKTDDSIDENSITKEQARIKNLKDKGYTKEQMIEVLEDLGLADNSNKQRMLSNIEIVYSE
jgi:hypothetical protein